MTAAAGLEAVDRELQRVVDRLNSMPLAKAATASDDVRVAAEVLLEQLRRLDPAVPPDATLPDLGPQGLGAMIAVLGQDWQDAARASSDPDTGTVLDALVELRRALP